MDSSENTDKWQQLERWKTQLYQIGSASDAATAPESNLLDSWCAHLHRAAVQISPHVHSFYVCLYTPDMDDSAPLWFVYENDEGYRAEVQRRPLGSGPTSLVVRTGQPYLLTPQTRLYHTGATRFGHVGRASLSAVHLPLRFWRTNASDGPESDAPVLRGVVSAQSYRAGLWTRRDTPFVLDLQSRADDAAQHWFNTVQKSPAV